jgi:hypothetical protein
MLDDKVMKFIQFGNSHIRNEESFVRGCRLYGIEYKKCFDLEIVRIEKPDLIWSPMEWFDPQLFPDSKILFGPQFFVFPDKCHEMYSCTPQRDMQCYYDVLSEWVKNIFQNSIVNEAIPYVCLPFGVDTEGIMPTVDSKKDIDCMIYFKDRHPRHLKKVEETVSSLGISYKIIRYGNYLLTDYFSLLDRSRFCIWIGRHESQGFGLQECLSKDIPIFLYDVVDMKEEYIAKIFKKKLYHWFRHTVGIDVKKIGYIWSEISARLPATAAPYWDDRCGVRYFENDNNLQDRLSFFISHLSDFRPREFVVEKLSDKTCFNRLLVLFNLQRVDDPINS